MSDKENTQTSVEKQPNTTPELDMKSVLDRIQSLEREKSTLATELQNKDAKLHKFTESKRVEMQQTLDSVIQKWLQSMDTKVCTRDMLLKSH